MIKIESEQQEIDTSESIVFRVSTQFEGPSRDIEEGCPGVGAGDVPLRCAAVAGIWFSGS